MQFVKAPAGKASDKAAGLSSADMSVVQDQLRASFEAIHDLKERLDSTDKQLAGYVKLLMLITAHQDLAMWPLCTARGP